VQQLQGQGSCVNHISRHVAYAYQSNPPHANVCTLTWSQTCKYLMLYNPYSEGQPFGSSSD